MMLHNPARSLNLEIPSNSDSGSESNSESDSSGSEYDSDEDFVCEGDHAAIGRDLCQHWESCQTETGR